MKKTVMLVATTALMTTLAACGTDGVTTDATTDEPVALDDSPIADAEDDRDAGNAMEADGTDATDATDSAAEADGKETEHETARADAEAAGKTVLIGTVRMVDGPDIFEYEGVDAEMMGGAESEEGNTYAILELDEEEIVSGMGADGSPRNDEKVDHIGLGDDMPKYDFTEDTASRWKEYDGKRICVAGEIWFPTDVSFPLSGRMSDAEVLYEE